jgi:uncharacterized membrane protein YccC
VPPIIGGRLGASASDVGCMILQPFEPVCPTCRAPWAGIERVLHERSRLRSQVAALVQALHRCADKLKAEYDRQQPDATRDECWAEAEDAFALLKELDPPQLPTTGFWP